MIKNLLATRKKKEMLEKKRVKQKNRKEKTKVISEEVEDADKFDDDTDTFKDKKVDDADTEKGNIEKKEKKIVLTKKNKDQLNELVVTTAAPGNRKSGSSGEQVSARETEADEADTDEEEDKGDDKEKMKKSGKKMASNERIKDQLTETTAGKMDSTRKEDALKANVGNRKRCSSGERVSTRDPVSPFGSSTESAPEEGSEEANTKRKKNDSEKDGSSKTEPKVERKKETPGSSGSIKEARSPSRSAMSRLADYKIPKKTDTDKPLVIHIDDVDRNFIDERSKNTSDRPIIKLERRSMQSDMEKLKSEVKRLKPFDIDKLRKFETNINVCQYFTLDKCRYTNVQKHNISPGSFTTVAHICAVCHWAANACEYHSAVDCPMVKLK